MRETHKLAPNDGGEENVAQEKMAKAAQYSVDRRRGSHSERLNDSVAVETAVALSYNGVSHAVMMASPADLEDFALGFSLSEGIIQTTEELYDSEVIARDHGLEIACEISNERMSKLKERRRNLTGRTGCGICGAETLEQAVPKLARLRSPTTISAQALRQALVQLEQQQPTQELTGSTHAAAWADPHGRIQRLREDVGRHNALDKLIGALHRGKLARGTGFAVVTSRASYEMVQKTVSAGIPILVAVSAPTSLAIHLARDANLALVGFARGQNFVIYAGGDRILD